MIITDFLERNARLYGNETALVEINPSELYPENAERLQQLIVEAIREANEDATITEEQYSWAFISEDLCLGC